MVDLGPGGKGTPDLALARSGSVEDALDPAAA